MEIVQEWYLILSRLSALMTGPLGEFSTRLNLPPASAFLFGLIGAVAPCQLTTNASAIAYLSRGGSRAAAGTEAGAYLLGKVLVYTLLGSLALALGAELQRAAIPLALIARRALGPILFLIGLSFLGVIRLRGGVGTRLSERMRHLLPVSGPARAFLMGGTFALAFCPTLFWLFFGLTIPLGLQSPLGFTFPALFAVGTSVPVLFLGGLLATSAPSGFPAGYARASRLLTRVAGLVFIVAGANDTLTYWAL